jgi:hypothetical protein
VLEKTREKKLSVIVVLDRRVHYWEWLPYETRLISQLDKGWRILEVMISPSGFAGDMLFLAPQKDDKTDLAKFYYGEKQTRETELNTVRVYVDAGRCYVIQPTKPDESHPFEREYELIEDAMDECLKSRDIVTSVYGQQTQ